MSRAAARFAVPIVALALLVAACGDDAGSPFTSSTGADGESTTTAAEGVTTTGAGETTTSLGGGETTSTTGGPGGAGDLEELLERFRTVPLRTTYLVGEDQEEMTFSQDPTQDPPVSAVIFTGVKIITLEDSYIICSGEGQGSQCFEMPSTEGVDMAAAMLGPFASLALSLQGMTDTPGAEVETEQVSIAGRTGVCFTYRPGAIMGGSLAYARSCIDSELGFALLLEVRQQDSDEVERLMELIAVGDPRPEDFEPTGPVIPIPDS